MAYEIALNLAWENLAKLDPEEISRRNETEYDRKEKRLVINFLQDNFIIDLSARQVFYSSLKTKSKNFISVLILHYLIGVKDIPLSGKKISFKDLPGGDFYFPAFRQNCLLPLIRAFSDRPQDLLDKTKHLEAMAVPLGDSAVEVKTFERFPITAVVWGKDSEFSGEANILYDAATKEFLPTEDVVMATSLTVTKLVTKKGIVSLKHA